MKPLIHLIVCRPDGRESTAEIEGATITGPMIDAAEDLLHTLTTGERLPIKGLYDLCARAFGTSHDDAKERLLAASHGMSEAKIEAKSESHGQILARLATTRREHNAARANVMAWWSPGVFVTQSPEWDRYTRACAMYNEAVSNMEAWLDAETVPA